MDDELLQCKYCDQHDFGNRKILEIHQNTFHPSMPLEEKTILDEIEPSTKDDTSSSDRNEHHDDQHLIEDEPVGLPEEPRNQSYSETNSPNNSIMPYFEDPYPMFSGKRLKNKHAYICYLNSLINGLLSLKNFRNMIQFMEPSIKDLLTSVLEDELDDLEQIRVKLHKLNSDFSFGAPCDPCEALTKLMELVLLRF